MPDIDLFDKIENFLQFQKEMYGSELFLSGAEMFPPEAAAKIDIDAISFEQDEKSVVMEKGIKYKADLNDSMFQELPATQATKGSVTDSLERKLKKATSVSPDWYDSKTMDELRSRICNCSDCQLATTRTNFVFGVGNPHADIVVIGEAPGADEDAKGEPFVGRAGQLLTKILQAIGLERDQVYICNILKCRPPGNRRPETAEVDECEPYLVKQIDLIKPQFILALGLTAVDTLLKKKHKMADTRGNVFDYRGYRMLVTYHPSALLRNPNLKKPTWEDVQLLRKMYDEYLSKK